MDITIKRVGVDQIDDIIKLRENLFAQLGEERSDIVNSRTAMRIYFNKAIPDEKYFGWLAYNKEGLAVASGGMVIHYDPPTPKNLSGKTAYIMNVNTIQKYQRRGIGKKIMEVMIAYAKEIGINKITLHSSKEGRKLYKKLGFQESPEMTLRF